MNIRLKRLDADYQEMTYHFMGRNPYIRIKSFTGTPAENYEIEYHLKGLEQQENRIDIKDTHIVEIALPLEYPRQAPRCKMRTPIFHPNIASHAICIGDHWAAGESLVNLIVHIGEMICYQSYNIKSPLNGEAAKWANENLAQLPIDTANLILNEQEEVISERSEAERLVSIEQDEDLTVAQATSTPSDVENPVEICLNCGVEGGNIQFQNCANGHFVCADCTLECQSCGMVICVLCAFDRGRSLEEIICADCQLNL